MGLLEEAIAEFKLTHEGEPKFVESRHMLGLCFMEQGDYYKAIAEIGNALNYSESLSGEGGDRTSMHYDLALAYQGAGNMNEAMSEFQKVSNLDAGYLDTAAKLKEMEKGEFISLDQLKEDIEKEISAKFFEEGERIEREEKIRKNEKMKS
jgi:tetratricopeptide (TPR) repeat protein